MFYGEIEAILCAMFGFVECKLVAKGGGKRERGGEGGKS